MNELIKLSIKKRFFNKTNYILCSIIICLFFFLCFADKIIEAISPSYFLPIKVKTENIDTNIFGKGMDKKIKISEDAKILIKYNQKDFLVETPVALDDYDYEIVDEAINRYALTYNYLLNDYGIKYNHSKAETAKESKMYVIITGMYFMMINFSTIVVNEVITEKRSNIIELLGTIIPISKHFMSKILISIMSILMQLVSILLSFLTLIMIRYFYDKGKGILNLLDYFGIFENNYESIVDLYKSLKFDTHSFKILAASVGIFVLGMTLIQIIMVLISSKVESVEEAGAIQGPFYIFLLFIYYLVLFFKNSQSLDVGWGYILSFTPIFSMLLLPMRMMEGLGSQNELLLSYCISIIFNVVVYLIARKSYVKSIFYRKSEKG